MFPSFSSLRRWNLAAVLGIVGVCLLAVLWAFWPLSFSDIFINILQRAVEELEHNSQADFYSLLHVRQDSPGPRIHAAYMDMVRAQAYAEDAWRQVTLLGCVNFVLRDPALRSKYDDMLRKEGRYLVPAT